MFKATRCFTILLMLLAGTALSACDFGFFHAAAKKQAAGVCHQNDGKINRKAAMRKDCHLLSDYRLFAKPTDPLHHPRGNGLPYTVTTLLFSNYASKARFIFIPPGKHATYSQNMAFGFPVGTVVVKTFYYNKDLRDPSSANDLIETRLLIHRKNGWVGLPYVWNKNNTRAVLDKYGAHVDVHVTGFNGKPRTIPYDVPTIHNCTKCHRGPAGNVPYHPEGIKARYLNFTYTYPDGSKENQLAHMERLGLLKGAPKDPADNAPKAPRANNPDVPLGVRARAYLDANCGYCHRRSGYANVTGLWLTDYGSDYHFKATFNHYGICKPTEAGGRANGKFLYDIVPGKPDKSILIYRISQSQNSTSGPSIGVLMPPLSRSVVDVAGVKLLRKWIKNMSGSCAPTTWQIPKTGGSQDKAPKTSAAGKKVRSKHGAT